MDIGQRILQARLDAGLSQRQLAGESITRNMLSAIEHGKARPSLETLLHLSKVLDRPVGYFLGEDPLQVKGFPQLEIARAAFDRGEYRRCLDALAEVPEGDVLGRERDLLQALAVLGLAEQALTDGREPYARKLLEEPVGEDCPYFTEPLQRKLTMLRCRAGLSTQIPEEDSLILRSREALKENRFADAVRYLNAVDHRDEEWHYLMGEALFGQQDYRQAADHYTKAEPAMGKSLRRRLQLCYAELKDFEKAYYYATME